MQPCSDRDQLPKICSGVRHSVWHSWQYKSMQLKRYSNALTIKCDIRLDNVKKFRLYILRYTASANQKRLFMTSGKPDAIEIVAFHWYSRKPDAIKNVAFHWLMLGFTSPKVCRFGFRMICFARRKR